MIPGEGIVAFVGIWSSDFDTCIPIGVVGVVTEVVSLDSHDGQSWRYGLVGNFDLIGFRDTPGGDVGDVDVVGIGSQISNGEGRT